MFVFDLLAMPLESHAFTWFCSAIWLGAPWLSYRKSTVWTPQCYQALSSHVQKRKWTWGRGWSATWAGWAENSDISGYCAAHFFQRSEDLVYFCTVDSALDNCNVRGTPAASSWSLGSWIFPSSCMTPTATVSTCDDREKNSHVTGYIDIEFMIRVGWVCLQPASYLTLTTQNNWSLPAVQES